MPHIISELLWPLRGMVVLIKGLLMPFGYQLWVLFEAVGVKRARSAARGPRFYDGLAELVGYSFA